jgi:hypothetical protein
VPSFTITPVSVESAVGDDFPNFIQFQFNGVNLGGPDADTVNFVGSGFTVTRGSGDDANTITVTVG